MIVKDRRLFGGAAGIAIAAALGGFVVARCTAEKPPAQEKTAEGEESDGAARPKNEVRMSASAIAETGIAVEQLAAGGLNSEIVAQATVSPAPTGEAIITARAGGTVTRILKRLGDAVGTGEALAILESRDAAQFAAERTSAAAKSVLAQRTLERERYLYQQRVSARVDLEQAQAEAAAAAAEARRAQVVAAAARVTGDGRGVVVPSPISGRVTMINARLGAFVQPETELFRVSDPRQIQIEASVSAGDAARLLTGDRAIVELGEGRTIEGRVRSVTPTVNAETRAATAVIDIAGASVPPGLAVRVRLLPTRGTFTKAIVVPEEAVQSLGGRDVVFVRTTQGFAARPVTTGQRSAGRIEVLGGLASGQWVATTNAFLLKAELAKPAGEED